MQILLINRLTRIREGDDGAWSTFFLRVGEPEQVVRVLPSTAAPATWVVMDEGCQPASQECTDARGGLVNLNESTSRRDLGIFDLNLELNLGHNESGLYGLDTLALGANAANGSPPLDSQVVVGIETNNYRFGILGLSDQPMNVSNFSHPYPSVLSTMKAQNIVTSLYYAYTAGAKYRKSDCLLLSVSVSWPHLQHLIILYLILIPLFRHESKR